MATMTRRELLRRLGEPPLSARRRELGALVRDAILVRPEPRAKIAGDAGIALGASKLGGDPDLPRGARWPAVDGVPLGFIAQVRLADVAKHDRGGRLPGQGLLSFFFDTTLEGYDRGEAPDRARVLFIDESAELRRRPRPAELDEAAIELAPTRVRFGAAAMLPTFEDLSGDFLPAAFYVELSPEQGEAVRALRREASPDETWLLGEPHPIQGGELRFQLVQKLDVKKRFEFDTYESKNHANIAREMARWTHLFQFGLDANRAVDWGTGNIYFWIRDDDLRARRFERAVAIMQAD